MSHIRLTRVDAAIAHIGTKAGTLKQRTARNALTLHDCTAAHCVLHLSISYNILDVSAGMSSARATRYDTSGAHLSRSARYCEKAREEKKPRAPTSAHGLRARKTRAHKSKNAIESPRRAHKSANLIIRNHDEFAFLLPLGACLRLAAAQRVQARDELFAFCLVLVDDLVAAEHLLVHLQA